MARHKSICSILLIRSNTNAILIAASIVFAIREDVSGRKTRLSRIVRYPGRFVEAAVRRKIAQVSASPHEVRTPGLRYFERLAIPNGSHSEKTGSSTLGVSRPRTRNAFQLLKSFKPGETMPNAAPLRARARSAVRIFSARRHRG